MRTTRTFVLASVLAVLPTAAQAYDLTGTWTGKWTCKGFDGEKFTTENKTAVMRISQPGGGNAIYVDLDNGGFRYNGEAIPDTAKPEKGDAVFIACPTDNDPLSGIESEMVRATVKTKAGTFKASFKALSIFEDEFVGVGTCKYSLKRTSTTDPGVVACPD
jgi:hypothetical protein